MSVIVQCISSILIATFVSMLVNWSMGLVAWAVMPCHFIGGLIQAKSAKGFSGDSAAAHYELINLTSEFCLWNIAHAVALWYTTILVDRKQATFENGIRAYQIFSLTVPSITELWTLIPTVISAIGILTPAFHTLDRKTKTTTDVEHSSKIQEKCCLFS